MDISKEKEVQGKIWLVGAGPGDAGLLTQKARAVIAQAQVIVFDALVSLEILSTLPEDAELINVGKRSHHHLAAQEEINEILCTKAREGKRVVRLKGGDPFVFGRGGEELEIPAKEGIPFEVVPGITSAVAVPSYNGIPVTHREYTSSFHVITGHKKKDGKLDIDFASLVRLHATLIFLMGVSELEVIVTRLMENGMDPQMPAAILERGTTYGQKRVIATVGTLYEEAKKAGIKSPAVIVVGEVCALESEFAWYEKLPLFGRQILVTRPWQGQSMLTNRLKELGAQAICFPTIRTIPRNGYLSELDELLGKDEPLCLTFTSPRGVEYFFAEWKREKRDIRSLLQKKEISFAVIGSGTGKELERYGIIADYMPDKYSAEELGKRLSTAWGRRGRVCLLRAAKGSPKIIRLLEEHQIRYKDIPVYDTKLRTQSAITEQIQSALSHGEIDAVMFTSASTVLGFVESFPLLDYAQINAVCIGEQTASEAKKYGMQIRVAKEASIAAMIEELLG